MADVKIRYNLDEILKNTKPLYNATLIDDTPLFPPLDSFTIILGNPDNKKYILSSVLSYDVLKYHELLKSKLVQTFGNKVSMKGEGILYNDDDLNLTLKDEAGFFDLQTSFFDKKNSEKGFEVFFGSLEKILEIPNQDLNLKCDIYGGIERMQPQNISIKRRRRVKPEFSPMKLSGYSFRNVGGQKEAVNSLKKISDFFKNPGICEKWGYRFPKGVLLYGPSGTGKTLLAKAFSCESACTFYPVNISDIVDMWYGESERKLQNIFNIAAKQKRSVLFFDELDALARARESSQEYGAKVVNVFLSCMDGFNSAKNVIVLGATNYKDCIDKAFLRPGRFDKQIEFTYPTLAERKQIMEIHKYSIEEKAKRKIFDDEISFENIAGMMPPKTTGADIEGMFNNILEEKINQEIRKKREISLIKEIDFRKNLPKKTMLKIVGFKR